MGVSILEAIHSNPVDRWSRSVADVQALVHGVLETVWFLWDEAQ